MICNMIWLQTETVEEPIEEEEEEPSEKEPKEEGEEGEDATVEEEEEKPKTKKVGGALCSVCGFVDINQYFFAIGWENDLGLGAGQWC